MKKMYNQPKSSVEELMPTSIICASITGGPDADPDTTGDAPARGVGPAVPGGSL